MPAKKKPTQVELVHPSGGFTVTVDPTRAEILRRRGYRDYTAADAAKAKTAK